MIIPNQTIQLDSLFNPFDLKTTLFHLHCISSCNKTRFGCLQNAKKLKRLIRISKTVTFSSIVVAHSGEISKQIFIQISDFGDIKYFLLQEYHIVIVFFDKNAKSIFVGVVEISDDLKLRVGFFILEDIILFTLDVAGELKGEAVCQVDSKENCYEINRKINIKFLFLFCYSTLAPN